MIRSEKEVNDTESRPAKANLTWKFKIQNTRDVHGLHQKHLYWMLQGSIYPVVKNHWP